MKYVKEFGIILIVSLVGELLNYFLPLPVPASIYGLVLMFLCLMLGVIKLSDVHDTACFLLCINKEGGKSPPAPFKPVFSRSFEIMRMCGRTG